MTTRLAMDHAFELSGLGRHPEVERLFSGLPTVAAEPDEIYEVTDSNLAAVVAAITRRAVRSVAPTIVLHAAAVGFGGAAVLLAGRGGAGKSTLCAALTRAGATYFTDEASAVRELAVLPYAKPLSLRAHGRALLASFDAAVSSVLAQAGPFVSPCQLGARVAAGPVPVRAVVLLERSEAEAEEAVLEPLHPADVAVELVRDAFNMQDAASSGLRQIAHLTVGLPCYRLRYRGLDEAVGSVRRLLLEA